MFYFNHENIEEVIFKGYIDAGEERYLKLYHNWTNKNLEQYKKGKVSCR